MASLGSLILDLVLKTGTFETDLGRAAALSAKRAKEIDKTFSRLSSKLKGVFAGVFAGFTIHEIIEATAEAEKSFAALTVALKNNAGAAGLSSEELNALAEDLQKVTTFSDDAVRSSEALLLSFRQISGQEFERAERAILDLATALGTDLQSATKLVGRALADPIKGMTALSRAGVVLDETQKNLVKRLVETGNQVGAQGVLLNELEKRFGGAAEAARDTFGGAIEGLKNAFKDLLEIKGGLPDAVNSLNELSTVLQDPRTKQAADSLLSTLLKGFAQLASLVAGTVSTIRTIGSGIASAFGAAADESVDAIQQELLIIQKLKTEGAANPDRLRFFGTHGLVKWFDDADLDKEMKRLQSIIDARKPKKPLLATGAAAVDIPVPPSEAFEKLSKELNEQIALHDKTGKAAKLAYQIETDAIEGLTAAEGKQLLTLAKQVDAQQKSDEQAKAAAQSRDKAVTDLTELNASLEQQAAVFGLTDAEALKYRLTLGDLSKEVQDAGDKGRALADSIIAQADAFDKLKDTKEVAAALEQVGAQIDELHGKLAESAVQQFDKQNAELVKKLGEQNNQTGLEQVATLRKLVGAQAEFNDLQRQSSDIENDLARQEDRIRNSRDAGAINDIEMQRQLGQARTKAAADLQTIADKQKVIADASGNPQLLENTKAMAAEIDNLRAQTDLLAQSIRTGFEDSFSDAFADFIDGTKSAADAFKDFINDIEKQITQLITKNLSQSLFKSIGGGASTGGGSAGGFFDFIAGLFGGGRATGGDVEAGKFYRINEREPEYFAPNAGGKVIPLSRIGNEGRGGVVVNQNIQVQGRPDSRTAQQLAVQSARLLRVQSARLG